MFQLNQLLLKRKVNKMKVKSGIWAHYKGGKYLVFGVCKHTEIDEEFVVYQSMETKEIWIRPAEMFIEDVDTFHLFGKRGLQPRFQFLYSHDSLDEILKGENNEKDNHQS